MRILIVDDDAMLRDLLGSVLTKMGHEVSEAANGLLAMDMLRMSDCRLVIADWNMPEMDGVELCRAIRTGELGRYIYIILLTAQKGIPRIVEGLSAGADEFMSKPFEPEELEARIHTAKRILSLQSHEVTIFALAKLAESRDTETGLHLERTRSYARVLAEDLARHPNFADKIDPEFIRLIYQTSPLHDIGKVSIPDHILLKPGRLDDSEFEIMKTHAAEGAHTMDEALQQHPEAQFLRMARDIAATHHERFDGGGYPAGLAGEAIPLCGRIFSVADVYDALVTKRVYKEAFSHSIANNIILEGRGTQFDPDVVDAFRRCESSFIKISQSFAKQASQDAVAHSC
jgi:putative two-component system response regulator